MIRGLHGCGVCFSDTCECTWQVHAFTTLLAVFISALALPSRDKKAAAATTEPPAKETKDPKKEKRSDK
jgi:hypothetical protein